MLFIFKVGSVFHAFGLWVLSGRHNPHIQTMDLSVPNLLKLYNVVLLKNIFSTIQLFEFIMLYIVRFVIFHFPHRIILSFKYKV